jgi:uncharacterized protein involved in outer membrane biogenesis
MTPGARKKLLIGGGGFVGLVIVALAAAPFFIDANSYKPLIVSQVKTATGRDLVLDGPISLSLLPTPTVSVQGVKFFNAPGSKNANMVEVKSVTVKPSLLGLLGGNIEIGEVTLVEPKIVLEINAEGKPNWEFTPSVAEAKPAAPKPSTPRPLTLGRLTIDNGTLIFSDSKAGLSVVAEKANFSASVGSIDGPYTLAGGATINGSPLKLDLAVGAKSAAGHNADVALQAGGGKLTFKGTLSELGPAAKVAGVASVSADSLTTFIGTLVRLSGQPEPALPPLLAGKFLFDGGIEASQTAFAAKNFKIALGQDNGSGNLAVTLKPKLAVEGKVAVPKLDLDKWLAAVARPATAPVAPPAAPPAAGRPAAAAPAPAQSSGSLLGDVDAKLAFEVGEVIYNKKPVRNIVLDLESRSGAVAVPKLSATLPGDMVLQARSTMTGDAARPQVSGDFSLTGPKLRETLGWLEVDVSSVPASKLQKLSLKGRMASTGGNVTVSDAAFELDDLKGTGGVVVTFGVPLSIVTSLNIDTIDLDSFLVPASAQQKPASSGASAPSAASSQPAVGGPTVGLKAKVNRVIYNKETIQGVDVDVALQGSTLRLNDVKVSNLGGARLAVRGSVANYSAAQPRPDIAFNFEAPDMGRVLKVLGTTGPSDLGAVTASGGVAGSIEQLTLRDLNVNAMGHAVKATGTLALAGAAKGAPQSAAYKGSLSLNGQTLEGSIDARLTGKTTINADLRAGTLDLDRISGSGGGAARAPARGQPAAANKPIDTEPLRRVDGSLKLVAGTLISAPLRIGNADLAATLKDGVLTVQHFKGSLYGGSLAMSGVVNGSGPALAFDFKGDANGISLSEMLRSTSGSNQFGSAVKVTIDGRLNANGITIKGGGTTSAQIKSSMAGGAQLGGHIFVGADRALQVLGGVAAGAAGTVIDNTLGNVLGAVGQRGGVGAGNLLNAIALVLNRFVNHDSPIGGQIDIAGGVVSDKGLTVQGNRATARISTRTNLAASTTDTTVNFYIAEDGSAPYLTTTARGPTSSPSLNVTRGTAKDPPGMASTLPGVSNILPGGGGQQQPGGQQRSLVPNIPIPNIFGR